MRQKSYNTQAVVARMRSTTRRLRFSMVACRTSSMPLYFCGKRRQLRMDQTKLVRRTLAVSGMSSNLNIYSDLCCLQDFRFRLHEIPMIAEAISWTTYNTKRSGYRCCPITTTFLLLRRLAYPCRWVDLELFFGLHSPSLGQLSWEYMECFYEKRRHLLTTFRSEVHLEKTAEYASVMEGRGAPLDNCLGFIDCTKVQMCRLGGPQVISVASIRVINAFTD